MNALKLKKLIKPLLILQLLVLGFIANAQTRGGTMSAQSIAEKDLADLNQVVTLTAEQKESVTPIIYAYADDKQQAYDSYKNDPTGLKAELAALDKRMDKELFAILTAEQQEKWKAHRQTQASKATGPMIRQ